MTNSIVATITTYNPDMDLLEKNIDSVIGQVDKLIVYENNSRNRDEIIELCDKKNVEIILNDKNYGVAGPLHDGIIYAVENNYRFILTLDQDSVSSEGMVEYLYNKFESDNDLAVAAAKPITVKAGYITEDRYVNSVITSGSLFDVKKIYEIGNYIPEMFIDWVDIEICYRIRESGYKILQCKTPLYHRFGDPVIKKLFWRSVVVTNYSKDRLYYIWRNSHYCFKRYKKDKKFNRFGKLALFKLKIKILLFESKKFEKFAAIKRGKKDARVFYKDMCEKYKIQKS